jgi:hypothetical protein
VYKRANDRPNPPHDARLDPAANERVASTQSMRAVLASRQDLQTIAIVERNEWVSGDASVWDLEFQWH